MNRRSFIGRSIGAVAGLLGLGFLSRAKAEPKSIFADNEWTFFFPPIHPGFLRHSCTIVVSKDGKSIDLSCNEREHLRGNFQTYDSLEKAVQVIRHDRLNRRIIDWRGKSYRLYPTRSDLVMDAYGWTEMKWEAVAVEVRKGIKYNA